MNPRQLGLMMHPESGRVAIVLKKPRATEMIRDVTTDFVLMQVAEILNEGGKDAKGIAREHVVTDAYGNRLTVEVTCRILERVAASPSEA